MTIKINFIKKKQPKYGFVYSMSQKKIQVLEKIDENLTKGFIRTSSFLATLLILFVRKPSGNFRFCVNFKILNPITTKNKYLSSLIQEILNRLTKTKYFTKLNIVVVFNRIRIIENKKSKNVFRIKYGFYEFFNHKFRFLWNPISVSELH